MAWHDNTYTGSMPGSPVPVERPGLLSLLSLGGCECGGE